MWVLLAVWVRCGRGAYWCAGCYGVDGVGGVRELYLASDWGGVEGNLQQKFLTKAARTSKTPSKQYSPKKAKKLSTSQYSKVMGWHLLK